MSPLKTLVQIKNQEVALPLVAESTILVVEDLPTLVMNLLLLQMIPRGNVFTLYSFHLPLSNFTQSKVFVKMVEAGPEAGVVVEMVVVVEAVLTTSTVKLAKRMFSLFFLSFFVAHSYTSDSDKKIHQGWGGDNGNNEYKTEQAASVDAAVESGTNEWNAESAPTAADWTTGTDTAVNAWVSSIPNAAAAADPWNSNESATAPAPDNDKPEGRPRRDREPEEEDNTLTLSQYLAQQKEKDSAIPKLENTRKANEGAGDDLWKDAIPLSKNEEEDAYFVGKVRLSFFAISIY